MPRNEDYNKEEVLRRIKKKTYYHSISRDFSKEVLGDYYSMIDNEDEIIDHTYDFQILVNELLSVASSYIKDNKDATKLIRIASISGLLWNLLEEME